MRFSTGRSSAIPAFHLTVEKYDVRGLRYRHHHLQMLSCDILWLAPVTDFCSKSVGVTGSLRPIRDDNVSSVALRFPISKVLVGLKIWQNDLNSRSMQLFVASLWDQVGLWFAQLPLLRVGLEAVRPVTQKRPAVRMRRANVAQRRWCQADPAVPGFSWFWCSSVAAMHPNKAGSRRPEC